MPRADAEGRWRGQMLVRRRAQRALGSAASPRRHTLREDRAQLPWLRPRRIRQGLAGVNITRGSMTLLVPCALCPVPCNPRSTLPMRLPGGSALAALNQSDNTTNDADEVLASFHVR